MTLARYVFIVVCALWMRAPCIVCVCWGGVKAHIESIRFFAMSVAYLREHYIYMIWIGRRR